MGWNRGGKLAVWALAFIVALLGTGCLGQERTGSASTPEVVQTQAPATSVATQAVPTSAPTAASAPQAGAVAVASPTIAAAEPAAATKQEVFRQVEQATARLRGLQPTREVELRFMNQTELRTHLLESFDRDYTPEERARDQKLLVMLGLIRPDQDLTVIMLDLLTEQVLGFYDEDSKRMHLIAEAVNPTPSLKVTYAHEFVHALQDQHFNLEALDPPHGDNDDRSAAIQALVEGDAVLAMTAYAQTELSTAERREYARRESSGGSGSFDQAPLVLREELIFPYSAGAQFVLQLHREGGFGAIDAVFRDPPQSTEQILHPEKYAAREQPVAVTLPDLATAMGDGWRQTTANTLGELDARILVQQFTDRATAEQASIGWGGDRYALLEDGNGRAAVVVKSAWDSEQDAQEFFDAYSQATRNRLGRGARTVTQEPTRQALATDEYAILLALRGQEVVVVFAPDEAVMGQLGRELAP